MSLADWIVEEINLRYEVPLSMAKHWVEKNLILPMLNGLDEVDSRYRVICTQAINDFRRDRGLLPIAVTSRTSDYQHLGRKLQLYGAVDILPLTRQEVTKYLEHLGAAAQQLVHFLQLEPDLWELLGTPLMLNLITTCYARFSVSRTETDAKWSAHETHNLGTLRFASCIRASQ